MKNISISTFINIVFAVAFFAITLAFVFFITIDRQKYLITQHQRYDMIAESLLQRLTNYPSQEQLNRFYEQFKVEEITQRENKLNIINDSQLEMIKDSFLGRMRVFKQEQDFYIYVQQLSYNILLKDLKPKPYNFQIASLIYIIFLIIFYTLYILLRRKLLPLKQLHKQIEQFSNGDLNIQIQSVSSDEIGKIAKSFANAIEFIKNQSNSKNLFMRNMMHELRTPITKGMIIAETIPNVKDKQILQNAFERMNNIIKELSTVEKISSNLLCIHKEPIQFEALYKATLKIMLLENLPIKKEFQDFSVEVDSELFCIVLKNLLDNAMKFNTKNEIIAKANQERIEIISYGEKLKYELDYYTEPFSQEEKRSDGFGLGLYIVKTILDLHKFSFSYTHKNGQNIFAIHFKP
jgi:two-component system, OmpR family, sensor kinase